MYRAAAHAQPEVRERILDAAEALFREIGYKKVTVADIARKLGMSPANVYRFFVSKAAIREALAARMTGEMEESLNVIVNGEGRGVERLEKWIVEFHRMTLERYITESKVHEMVEVALRENWNIIEVHVRNIEAMIRTMLEAGQREGDFKIDDMDQAVNNVYHAILIFIDPERAALRLLNDDLRQARSMARFLVEALRLGAV